MVSVLWQLESIDAGVVVVDPNGLVVSANSPACRMIPSDSGLFGQAAQNAFPNDLWNAALGASADLTEVDCGRARIDERRVEWKRRPVKRGCDAGQVLTLWEVV